MGVELVVYRLRIGGFGAGRGYTSKLKTYDVDYNPYTDGPDIHYRMFATMFIILAILTSYTYMYPYLDSINSGLIVGFDQCSLRSYQIHHDQILCKSNSHVSMSFDVETHANSYVSFQQRMLVLSKDIESNPGPTDMEQVLIAIKASEDRVLGEIRSVKSEILSIKNDIVSVKNDQVKTKIEVNSVKQNQVDMSSDITNLQKDNKCLSELNDQMQLDIDFLHDTVDAKTVTIEKLEDDIDRLEVRARSDMMRIFGLPILPDESDENIGQHVVQNVLKVACPGVTWECDDLKRAFRVGGEAENQPPVVIVRFRYDDDKSKIFAGRDELRRHGTCK